MFRFRYITRRPRNLSKVDMTTNQISDMRRIQEAAALWPRLQKDTVALIEHGIEAGLSFPERNALLGRLRRDLGAVNQAEAQLLNITRMIDSNVMMEPELVAGFKNWLTLPEVGWSGLVTNGSTGTPSRPSPVTSSAALGAGKAGTPLTKMELAKRIPLDAIRSKFGPDATIKTFSQTADLTGAVVTVMAGGQKRTGRFKLTPGTPVSVATPKAPTKPVTPSAETFETLIAKGDLRAAWNRFPDRRNGIRDYHRFESYARSIAATLK